MRRALGCFSELERAVLDKLLAGDHPVLAALREQAQAARVASREETGVGFYLCFDVPPEVTTSPIENVDIADVYAEIEGLQHGASFVVFVRGGRLDMLEGATFDEPWPTEIRGFSLDYIREPRELDIPAQ